METYIRTGTHSRKPDLPYIPGGDGAGTVEDVGDGDTKFKVTTKHVKNQQFSVIILLFNILYNFYRVVMFVIKNLCFTVEISISN